MKVHTLESIVLGVAIGLVIGVGTYTFIYAQGWSYLTNNPAACANCHIMADHYDRWIKSPHRAVAVCNDCHTPEGFFVRYAAKASNGFWHSVAFTSGRYSDPLRIKPHNREITENACRRCHQEITEMIEGPHRGGERLSCITCHDSVGHIR
jgi:cytochrome c nitrite reductase small subunit